MNAVDADASVLETELRVFAQRGPVPAACRNAAAFLCVLIDGVEPCSGSPPDHAHRPPSRWTAVSDVPQRSTRRRVLSDEDADEEPPLISRWTGRALDQIHQGI